MYAMLAYGYELQAQFVPILIVLIQFRRNKGKNAAPFSKRHYVYPILFAFYIIAVFHVTGAGTVYDAMKLKAENLLSHVNLIPFSNKINVIGYLLNIVMFVPLGFLVPLIWNRTAKVPHVLLAGFSFSFLIEVSQLLSSRGTDIDDLILNTLGAVIGFLLSKAWNRVTGSRYQLDGISPIELPVYILTLYLGRCLLFNQLGLINLMYDL